MRGTTRDEAGAGAIEAAGIEPAIADPDRAMTVLDHVGDVSLVYWLLGSALGAPEAVAALHGPRLERLLGELVDTPVRGLVYEAAGSVAAETLESGAGVARAAADRWRIRIAVVAEDPAPHEAWTAAMAAAGAELLGRGESAY